MAVLRRIVARARTFRGRLRDRLRERLAERHRDSQPTLPASAALIAIQHPSVSLVWPSSGIAIAALILLGTQSWPTVFLGAFLVNVTTSGSVPLSLGIATGNTLERTSVAPANSRSAGSLSFATIERYVAFASSRPRTFAVDVADRPSKS